MSETPLPHNEQQGMLSFHNKPDTKTKYVNRLKQHYKQDEIIKGTYWQNGKGCAVGCTVHSDSHNCYEIELGIPEWLARLEDTLFENLQNEKAKEFPLQFLKSIPIGVTERQFTILKHKFFKYLLTQQCKNTDHETVKDAIQQVIQYHDDMINERFSSESAARSAAESAAESAWSAAESAAWSAESAARSAESAAESAARSAAESAARSAAESAARSAARSARSARSAWSAAIKEETEYLIKLLKESKKY